MQGGWKDMSFRELPSTTKWTVATGLVEVQFHKEERTDPECGWGGSSVPTHKFRAKSMQLVEPTAHLCKEGILLKLG
jgi:hypothetical protein